MPTGTTSTVMSNSPCFEPHNALLYKRSDKHGEHYVCNADMIKSLSAANLWTPEVKRKLMESRTGSIADIDYIPVDIKRNFKYSKVI